MERADFVIPECYVDTNLVETLVCNGGCNHQKGCNQVARIMQTRFADRFAVGVMDADKRRPGYLADFTELASDTHLSLLRHRSRPHFVILVHPAADGFILSCAAQAGVRMADYGLADTLHEFTAQTKSVLSNKDSRFRKLFRDMADEPEMSLMKSLLSHLVVKRYDITDRELVELFARR